MAVKILSSKVVEQIAAGEVVENPASVVKELVENSLDAGATSVEISVQQGGIKTIYVADNGEGIVPDDLPLIFQRYATSKINRLEDLKAITSLGFRGEALPSIAAVSRVTLTSRRRGGQSGYRIQLEGGKLVSNREVGAPEGTAILVEDLFYNTPARLKFLKSPPVETSRVSSLLSELSLAYPHTSFSLNSAGRNLFQTFGDGSLQHVLGSIYGLECARSLLPLNYKHEPGPVEISGCLSAPYFNRASRRGITIIVNKRVVKAPRLGYALERGYGNLLPRGRYPLAVLRIQLPPDLLDVNVHPSKSTVRFQHPEILCDLVYRAVKNVLRKRLPLPQLKSQDGAVNESLLKGDISPRERFNKGKPRAPGDSWAEEREAKYHPEYLDQAGELKQLEISGINLGQPASHNLRLIGQFLHSYLVAQRGEELLVIDQHAAHERVLYHKLTCGTSGLRAVQLTFPMEIEIPVPWRERFKELQGTLQEIGFKLEPFGDNNYIIRQLPVLQRDEVRRQ
ncbi:MAG TPA: DNA mismatch repair endonuclease MutL, partial [Firmicutes bacterium]|nr:DNA mismatch repair endonuclease MutL [Bacillota bacterium]